MIVRARKCICIFRILKLSYKNKNRKEFWNSKWKYYLVHLGDAEFPVRSRKDHDQKQPRITHKNKQTDNPTLELRLVVEKDQKRKRKIVVKSKIQLGLSEFFTLLCVVFWFSKQREGSGKLREGSRRRSRYKPWWFFWGDYCWPFVVDYRARKTQKGSERERERERDRITSTEQEGTIRRISGGFIARNTNDFVSLFSYFLLFLFLIFFFNYFNLKKLYIYKT